MALEDDEEQQLNAQLNGQQPTDETVDEVQDEVQDESQDETSDDVQDESHEEQHEGSPPQGKQSRAQARIQKLATERENERIARAQAEERARMLELQLQRMNQPAQRDDEDLDPDEKWRRQANATIAQTQQMAQDSADRLAFLTKYAKDPDIMAMTDEIEQLLADARSRGNNAPRENVLTFLLGKKALQARAKAPRVRQQAAERVNAARGAPLGTKSNVPQGKSPPSLEDKLDGVPL